MTGQRTISLGEAIREGLQQAAERDPTVLHFAEGVEDPTAVFGTVKNIGKAIGHERMIEMPISENGLAGIAVGAALAGKRPVISFHRVEFALLAMEQIVNNAAKTHYVSNGRHKVPIVIRMVIGRGWGQGPEHSQSLESVFAHFPGLKVVMPAMPADAKGMVIAAIEDDNPVIMIEHRWSHYATGEVPEPYYTTALDGPRRLRDGNELTLVSTSYMTLEAMRAADALAEIGHEVEVFDLRVLRPLALDPIAESVGRTGRLMTADTGFRTYGAGAEITAGITERCFSKLRGAPVRLGLPDHPTPSSRGLIQGFYPDAIRIIEEAGAMIGIDAAKLEHAKASIIEKRAGLPIDVPDPFFKGPF